MSSQTAIVIEGLRLKACHGVSDEERQQPQWFRLDLTADIDFRPAMASDCLEGTVSYADIYALILSEMQQPSKLLEHVAGRIVRSLRSHFPTLTHIRLKLLKEAPPIEGLQCQGCGVVIEE